MDSLIRRISGYQADMENFLEQIVNIDSGADAPEGTGSVARKIGGKLESLGFAVDFPGGCAPDLPVHVRGTRQGTGSAPKNVMITGHLDTVFPKGTAAERPMTRKDGKAYGPGVADMKSGITIALFALQGLKEENWSEHNLTVFFCGDEENGHPKTNAKHMMLDFAQGKDAVFNMETGNLDGSVVVGRKGLAYVGFRVDGIAAHSGKDPEKGASAIKELCHKIGRLYALDDPVRGISFNAGKITGGLVGNGIAAYAEFWGDCRFARTGDYDEIIAFFRRVAGEVHVARTHTTFVYDEKLTFLPMDQTEGNRKLYEVVRRQGEKLGLEVKGISLGSCSDSCWTVQAGAPTVCAMGGRGLFNHSPEEYLILSSLTERAQLLALSLQNI